MRRILILAALLSVAVAAPSLSFAQGQRPQDDPDADARKRERNKEFDAAPPPLPGVKALGPCPYVKVLYDAARYVEFKDSRQASANVAYSGEIEGISADCAYLGTNPIDIDLLVTFSLGRGPQAPAATKVYGYWVAVTTRNQDVLAKEHFAINAVFKPGENTVVVHDHVAGISIPRVNDKVMGSAFEVLVGFDLTPEMAEFNRAGKRFRVDADGTTPAGAPARPGPAARP